LGFRRAWRPRVRSAVEVPYWIVVGVLTIVATYFSVLYNSPPYFFWAALVLAVLGVRWPGPRYSWVALVGFGLLPALLLSLNLFGQIAQADWSCSKISFQASRSSSYGGPSGETVYCTTIPGQLIVAVAAFWTITLLGVVALLYILRRSRPHADTRVNHVGLVGIGVILLVVVGGIAFRAKDAAAPPPPEERAGLPPNGLPVSCPEGEGDIGYFNGVGDDTTPALKMTGDEWRYVYASSGSGSFSIEVVDAEGNIVPSSTASGVAGDEGHSSLLEVQGTFRLKIDADEVVGHTLHVCVARNQNNRRPG
jgi:hypothetical protein